MKKLIVSLLVVLVLTLATVATAFAGGHANRGNAACGAEGLAPAAGAGLDVADGLTPAINCQ